MVVENKQPDKDIQQQRRNCLCKLTKFVGAAGVTAAVWPLISALGPDETTRGENEPIDVSLAGIAAGQTLRRIWQGKLILIHHRTPEEIVAARTGDHSTLIDPQSDPVDRAGFARVTVRSLIRPDGSPAAPQPLIWPFLSLPFILMV